MRIPRSEHTSRPWRIHDIVPDFRLEDVWALPTPGGRDDFPRLVQVATTLDPTRSPSRLVRTLFGIRMKLGERLGLDKPSDGIGSRVASLRERLPADLRDGPSGPAFDPLPFTPVFQADDEFAAELANKTVHGVLHLTWVPDEAGGYRGRMAVYVKRNGLLGAAYMAAIAPFRRVLYPVLLRTFARRWQEVATPRR